MEEKRKEFLLETNKRCFICLNLLRDEEGTIGSFQNVCAHLKINVQQVFKDTSVLSMKQSNLSDKMEKWELKGRFCMECAQVAEEFKELFAQLQKIQEMVDQCLSKVQRKFLHGNSSMNEFIEDMTENPISYLQFGFVEALRKEAIERCSLVLAKKPLPEGIQNKLQKNQKLSSPNKVAESDIIKQEELPSEPEEIDVEVIDPEPPILSQNIVRTPTQPEERPSTSAQALRDQQNEKMMNEDEEVQFDGVVVNTAPVGQTHSNPGYGLRSSKKILNIKRFQCQDCPRMFKSLRGIAIHTRRLHAGMKFRCTMCPKAFATSHEIVCHTKKAHIKPEVQKSKKTSPLTTCDICQKTFTRRYMIQHRKIHTRGSGNVKAKNITDQPDSRVTSLRVMETKTVQRDPDVHEEEELGSFIIPMDGHHEEDSLGTTQTTTSRGKGKSPGYRCQCGKFFKTSQGLNLHAYRKHSRKSNSPHLCNICGKGFSEPDALQIHKDFNHFGKVLYCEKCLKTFSHPTFLQIHSQNGCHVGVK